MIVFVFLIGIISICVADSNNPCKLSTGFPGKCTSAAGCSGKGVHTGTGECPGIEKCCTVEYCYVGGLRGVCVTPGTCTGATHNRYCTGVGKCCTQGAAPKCSVSSGSTNSKLLIQKVDAAFLDSDREAQTKIQYCGVTNQCAVINPPSKVQVRWSTPSTSSSDQGFTGKSGLGFQPRSNIGSVPINDVFPIGTLTHYNFVVTGSTPNYVTLQLNLVVAGVVVPPMKYRLGIDETNNQKGLFECAYESVVPCADKIDFPDSGFSFVGGSKAAGSVSFRLPNSNVDLTLELGGFKRDCNDANPLDYWYTQEKVVNQAILYGRITRACPIADNCQGGQVIYDKANCRCKIAPNPTPVPATPAPTPVPPTPLPTPRPPAPTGFTWAPTPVPPPPTPRPPTPAPTPGLVIETPPTPMPGMAPTPVPGSCTPWYACLGSVVPTPPPVEPTYPTSEFSVYIQTDAEADNTVMIAALVGGIGGCLIITGIIVALCLFTGVGSAITGASSAAPAKENIVEGNPIFMQQAEDHQNPLFYSTGGPQPGYSSGPSY